MIPTISASPTGCPHPPAAPPLSPGTLPLKYPVELGGGAVWVSSRKLRLLAGWPCVTQNPPVRRRSACNTRLISEPPHAQRGEPTVKVICQSIGRRNGLPVPYRGGGLRGSTPTGFGEEKEEEGSAWAAGGGRRFAPLMSPPGRTRYPSRERG